MENPQKSVKIQVGLLLVLCLLMVVPAISLVKSAPSISIDSNTFFGFTNGWLNFNQSQIFSTIQQVGNTWYFDSIYFTLDSANCTIDQLFNWSTGTTLTFNSTGPSSTETFVFCMGYYGNSFDTITSIPTGSSWTFDKALNKLTIMISNVVDPATVHIKWKGVFAYPNLMFEYNQIQALQAYLIYGSYWVSQSFTGGVRFAGPFLLMSHTVTSVALVLSKVGSPTGNLNVSIQTAYGDFPSGTILTSAIINASLLTSSGAWYTIDMTSEITLQTTTKYVIVLSDPSDNVTNCVQWIDSAENSYPNSPPYGNFGCASNSSTSGSSWTANTQDDMTFEIFGNPVENIYNFIANLGTVVETSEVAINCTAWHYQGTSSIQSVTFTFSALYGIRLSWTAPNTFTVIQGSAVCSLVAPRCKVTTLDVNTETITFDMVLTGSQSESTTQVITANVTDINGYNTSNAYFVPGLFTYIHWTPGPGPGPNPNPGNNNGTTPGGTSNGTNPNNSTNPQNPTTGPNYILSAPWSPDLILLGVVFILVVVGIAGYYSGKQKRNPVNQARKQWNKQNKSKKTKWNRETE